MTCKSSFLSSLITLRIGGLLLSVPLTVQAGCGCEKPPPAPASVRPNVTYAGMPVTLFHSSLQTGVTYSVTFTAMNGQSTTVSTQPVTRRNLADIAYKRQLIVNAPNLPLGPVSISVRQAGQSGALLAISDSAFTLAPKPVVVPTQIGTYKYQNFQAAVGRNGVVYLSLDVAAISQPCTFKAQAKGYPLRFTSDGVVFYNTQGFLMQLASQPIPGLFSIASTNASVDSSIVQYARHEFVSYFLQHAEHEPHATDAIDGNWHRDGTRHIDHDHLILAIAGQFNTGAVPIPGATPFFTLELTTTSFFEYGMVGTNSISLSDNVISYSNNSNDYYYSGAEGDLASNGTVTLSPTTQVYGAVTGKVLNIPAATYVTGPKTIATQTISFLQVSVPPGIQDLGNLVVFSGQSVRLSPGSYKLSSLTVKDGGWLYIDNRTGSVTLYVTGPVNIAPQGKFYNSVYDPEMFAFYVIGPQTVALNGSALLFGCLYAPEATIQLGPGTDFQGGLVGKNVSVGAGSYMHYDVALRGQ